MRYSELPYLPDWFAITFRWLILLSLSVTLAGTDWFGWQTIAVLSLSLAWNVLMSMMAVFNRRLAAHRTANLIVDLVLAMMLFYFTNDMRGPLLWVGVLSIVPAAIYFGLRGSGGMAVLSTAVEVGILYFFDRELFYVVPLVTLAAVNIGTGLTIGLLSMPLLSRLRITYRGLVNRRRESEQQIQMRERDRMKALSDMIATFSATLNYRTVLEAAMNSSLSTMDLDATEEATLVCGFFLFEDSDLKYVVGRGLTAFDQSMPLPGQTGILGDVLRNGMHRLVQMDTCSDPELCKLVSLHECKSLLCMPLVRGMNAYGVLLFAHPDKKFFTDDRTELLLTVANQAVIAIQNARLFQDLAAEKERLVQSQEEAQKKLARDLHDGPTQSVSSIAMRINIARKLFERNPRAAMEELVQIEDLARRTTQEIRHMLFTLRPLVLENDGLDAALQTMASKMRDVYQQNVIIDLDPEVIGSLDTARQTMVFYLVEEAVNNARKHAEASEITVRMKFIMNDRSMAGLEISDNGRGFDVQATLGNYDQRGSLGMINLRERTDQLNGLLKIDSAPGRGTRIRIYIPLNEAALDRLHSKNNGG